jgi:phage-related protein
MNPIILALQTALTLIEALLTEFGVSPTAMIDKIIAGLQQILPALEGEAAALLPVVQNIINVAQDSGTLTPAQITALQALDSQADSAFAIASSASAATPITT